MSSVAIFENRLEKNSKQTPYENKVIENESETIEVVNVKKENLDEVEVLSNGSQYSKETEYFHEDNYVNNETPVDSETRIENDSISKVKSKLDSVKSTEQGKSYCSEWIEKYSTNESSNLTVSKFSQCLDIWKSKFPWMVYDDDDSLKCHDCREIAETFKKDIIFVVVDKNLCEKLDLIAASLRRHQESIEHLCVEVLNINQNQFSKVLNMFENQIWKLKRLNDIKLEFSRIIGKNLEISYVKYFLKSLMNFKEQKLVKMINKSVCFSVIFLSCKRLIIIRFLDDDYVTHDVPFFSFLDQNDASLQQYLENHRIHYLKKGIFFECILCANSSCEKCNSIYKNKELFEKQNFLISYPTGGSLMQLLSKQICFKQVKNFLDVICKLFFEFPWKFSSLNSKDILEIANSEYIIKSYKSVEQILIDFDSLRKVIMDVYEINGNMEILGASFFSKEIMEAILCVSKVDEFYENMNKKINSFSLKISAIKDEIIHFNNTIYTKIKNDTNMLNEYCNSNKSYFDLDDLFFVYDCVEKFLREFETKLDYRYNQKLDAYNAFYNKSFDARSPKFVSYVNVYLEMFPIGTNTEDDLISELKEYKNENGMTSNFLNIFKERPHFENVYPKIHKLHEFFEVWPNTKYDKTINFFHINFYKSHLSIYSNDLLPELLSISLNSLVDIDYHEFIGWLKGTLISIYTL